MFLIIYNGSNYKKVYESNFGTAHETYKEAVKKDNSIRLQEGGVLRPPGEAPGGAGEGEGHRQAASGHYIIFSIWGYY